MARRRNMKKRNPGTHKSKRNPRRVFQTEDGYTFYEQPDGTLTDSRDPAWADMTYGSVTALKRAVSVTEVGGKTRKNTHRRNLKPRTMWLVAMGSGVAAWWFYFRKKSGRESVSAPGSIGHRLSEGRERRTF